MRKEIFDITNIPSRNIYCILGGGTVNVGHQFSASSIRIAETCQLAARKMKCYNVHIVCSSPNIYEAINENVLSSNIVLHKGILDAKEFYSDAKLIITRSGRNTLSELAYLGIPAISFVTGDVYRKVEQQQNLSSLNLDYIKTISTDDNEEKLLSLINELLLSKYDRKTQYKAGNNDVIKHILNL